MMKILQPSPKVHLELLECWQKGWSACVLTPSTPDEQQKVIASYDGPPALVCWTSGTTGAPKAVAIEWSAVEARCRALAAYWSGDPALAVTVTLFSPDQSAGSITSRLAVHYAGFEPVELSSGRDDITCLFAAPPQIRGLCTGEGKWAVGADVLARLKASLQCIVSTGLPLDEDTRARIELTFPRARIRDQYASTETGAISIDGEVLPGYEVQIRDGIVHVKTRGLASRYFGTDERLKVDNEGWLMMPDSGAIINGRLKLFGRVQLRGLTT